MVTAEIAVAVPAVVVLLAMLLWAVALVGAYVQVVDAARAGARAAARGESVAASAAVAEQAAPPGADAVITHDAGDVRVAVHVQVEPPGGLAVLPSIDVSAVAYAAVEEQISLGPLDGRGRR